MIYNILDMKKVALRYVLLYQKKHIFQGSTSKFNSIVTLTFTVEYNFLPFPSVFFQLK